MKKDLVIILIFGMIISGCNQSPTITENERTANDSINIKNRAKNVEAIKTFFELLHQKELDEWSNLWDDSAYIYIPYPVADFPDTIRSKKTISDGFQKLLAGFKSFDYQILDIYPSVDPDILVVEYTVSAALVKTNAIYNGRNIAVFKFRDGKIIVYNDYFNPEKFKMVIEATS